MKKKLALLMAAIMTVAMVPMTAFASTKLTAVDEISTAVDKNFVSRVELSRNDDQQEIEGVDGDRFDIELKLTNGKFSKDEDDDKYLMNTRDYETENYGGSNGVFDVDVRNDTTAIVTISADVFNVI